MDSAPASSSIRPPPRRRWSRRLPWLGAAVLLALIVAGLWPKSLPVEVVTVTRGSLTVTVDEEGMTRVKNRYVISSPVAGHLRRIDWKPGAPVVAGYALAVLGCLGGLLAVWGQGGWPRWVIRLGQISYGLYVFHMLALMLVEHGLEALLHRSELPLAAIPVQAVLALAATLLLAETSYRFLERPFLKLKERFTTVLSRPV